MIGMALGLIKRNPIPSVLIVLLVGALALLGVEKMKHSATMRDYLEEVRLVAQLRKDQATTAAARAESIARALEIAQEEVRRFALQENELTAHIATQQHIAGQEHREASARLRELEKENEALRVWNDRDIPRSSIDWMLEPTRTAAASP